MWTSRLLLVVVGGIFLIADHSCVHALSESLKISIKVASSICGLAEQYKRTRELPPPIFDYPDGIPFVDGTEMIFFKKCRGGSCQDTVQLQGEDERKSRIIGGILADQTKPEFPWDVKLRHVYNWGSFFTDGATHEETEKNNISSIRESFYCTATLYNKRAIITARTCAFHGLNHAKSGNRFVAWFARKRYIHQMWIIPEEQTTPNQRHKTADVYIPETDHPPFSNGTAIIVFLKDLEFPPGDEHYFRGLEIPPLDMDFTDEVATVAGWGRVHVENEAAEGSIAASGPTKLYKLEVKRNNEKCLKGKMNEVLEAVKRHDLNCYYSSDVRKKHMCFGDYGASATCEKESKKYMCGMYFLRRDTTRPQASCDLSKSDPSKDIYMPFYNVAKHKDWYRSLAGEQDWL